MLFDGSYVFLCFNLVVGFNWNLVLGLIVYVMYNEGMCLLIVIEFVCVDLVVLCLLLNDFIVDLLFELVILKMFEVGMCGCIGVVMIWSVVVYCMMLIDDI